MIRPRSIRRFLADRTGAAAVEFALVSMIFLSLMVGTIDISRLLWEVNSCKAGTRAAARYAIVHQPASTDLVNFDATSSGTLNLFAGDPVPAATVAVHTCTSTGCTCGSTGYCGDTSLNDTTFDAIVALLQRYDARIEAENVVVIYTPVGLGLAGNPYGPDVEPLVTVRLCQASDADACTPMQFSPGVLQAFGLSPFDMPAVASSLSGEDLS
jgi:Flp pilus assembly protein TadG